MSLKLQGNFASPPKELPPSVSERVCLRPNTAAVRLGAGLATTGHNPLRMLRPRRRSIVRGMHLSRPMYEGLPWLYIGSGVAALGVSYIIGDSRAVGLFIGLAGLAALLGGVVVLLRRRDYRQLRSQYGQPDLTQRRDQD